MCVCVCTRVCVSVRTVSHVFFFSVSGSLSMRGGKRNCRWPKTATGSCVVQDQAPQQWLSVRSALQPGRWCNSGTSTMLAHSRAIIAYGDGCSKFQDVCVRACVCGSLSHALRTSTIRLGAPNTTQYRIFPLIAAVFNMHTGL